VTKDSTTDRRLLGDRLINVVDRIRGRIHGRLGTQQYRTWIVTRRWSGPRLGLGTVAVSEFELEPPPTIAFSSQARSSPGGREDISDATMTGVSLRYSLDELMPRQGDASVEVLYRVVEAHGQKQTPMHFALAAHPTARRGDKAGDATDWVLKLKRVQDPSGEDAVFS
jgi:hypothetical protein